MPKLPSRKGGKLTARQARYLKELPKANNKKEAAIRAGYSKETAENAKSQIDDHVGESRMREALERAGMTDDGIAKIIADAGKSRHPVYIRNGRGQDTSTSTKFVADHSTRIRAAEVAGKFRGDFEIKIKSEGLNPLVAAILEAQKEVEPKKP